jgi:GNAT superfamily N-acetyltransferase
MRVERCSVVDDLVIERGGIADYEALSRFHYRGGPCRPYVAVYVVRHGKWRQNGGEMTADRMPAPQWGDGSAGRMPAPPGGGSAFTGRMPVPRGSGGEHMGGMSMSRDPVGVIVYVNPPANHAARNAATGGVFSRLADRRMQLRMLNRNVRTIARVIIEPRYRGIGLGSRLVRETMPLLDAAMVEATAAMGAANAFFEGAGMQPFATPISPAAVRFDKALSIVGVGPDAYIDAERVQRTLDALHESAGRFIDNEMRRFLKPCIKRRDMRPGLERTRFVLSRLGTRCVYYLWFNPRRPPDWPFAGKMPAPQSGQRLRSTEEYLTGISVKEEDGYEREEDAPARAIGSHCRSGDGRQG